VVKAPATGCGKKYDPRSLHPAIPGRNLKVDTLSVVSNYSETINQIPCFRRPKFISCIVVLVHLL